MVVALLRPRHGCHPDDHRQFARAAQLLEGDAGRHRRDDNSRGKVQNVRGDSSAIFQASGEVVVFPPAPISAITQLAEATESAKAD
jgi:hypothetical protein